MGTDNDDRPKSISHRCYSLLVARYLSNKSTMICLVLMFLLVLLTMMASSITAAPPNLISTDELQERLAALQGGDERLMRWSATRHTAKRQSASCQQGLPDALAIIAASAYTNVGSSADMKKNQKNIAGLACEYATFCVTDNPEQRERLSVYGGKSSDDSSSDDSTVVDIHTSIVQLVSSPDSYTSATASHLIYIASFANRINQQRFAKVGAVSKLASVVTSVSSNNLQIMWAASALQNLAASYCESPNEDGRCYWKWKKNGHDEQQLILQSRRMRRFSDGEAMRQEMVLDADLMDRLMDLACTGPVQGEMTADDNPYVGGNAIAGINDDSPTIVAWAATGALKNIALSPQGRAYIEYSFKQQVSDDSNSKVMSCLCRMSHSPDWLEENKGQGALHHLRPSDPCWFQDDEAPSGKLCVDDAFLDAEGYTCSDYEDATEKECLAEDDRDHRLDAKAACCACGGGNPEESWSVSSTSATRSEL